MDKKEFRDYLIKYYDKKTNAEIEKETGVPGGKIRDWASRLGLKKPLRLKARRKYSDEEKAMIAEEYPNTPTKVLADKLGVKVESLMRWASEHGLKKNRDIQSLGEHISEACMARGLGVPNDKKQKIISLYPNAVDNKELMESVGVTYNQMRGVVKRFKLHKTEECLRKINIIRSQKVAEVKQSKITPEMLAERERKAREKEEAKEAKRLERERRKEARKVVTRHINDAPMVKKFVSNPHVSSAYFSCIEKPKSDEPCIGSRCKCYGFCAKNGKEIKYCDAYMFLKFTSEIQKEAVITGMISL